MGKKGVPRPLIGPCFIPKWHRAHLARQGSGPEFKRLARIMENINMEAEADVGVYPVYEIIKRLNEAEGLGEGSGTAIRRHASAFLQKRLGFIAGRSNVALVYVAV